MTKERQSKSSMGKFIITVTLVSVLAVTFITTQQGQAAIDRIKELFEPEKTIIETIEGIDEPSDVALEESEVGYIIYFDKNLYAMDSHQDADRIIPTQKPDTLPDTYMEIKQVKDISPVDYAAQLEDSLKDEFKTVLDTKNIEAPVEALFIYAEQGSSWDDAVVRYYLVDNNQGGTFVIKQLFFLEATEGFGARFDNMLREFKIIDIE